MIGRRGRAVGAALCAAAALFGAAAPSAFAASTTTSTSTSTTVGANITASPTADSKTPYFPASAPVGSVVAWMETAISLRTSALTALGHSITVSPTVTAADSAALQSLIGAGALTLSQLTSKVPAETTITALRADASAMVGAHILTLVTPVVNDVLAIDGDLSQAKALRQQWSGLGAAIALAHGTRAQVAQATRYERDLGSRLTNLNAKIGALGTTLLGLQVASWPAAAGTLRQAAAAIGRANQDLAVGQSDANQVVSLLAHAMRSSVRKTSKA